MGALVVGLTESFLTGYLPRNQYLPGLRLAAPALILLLVLLVIPNPRLKGRTRSREEFPMPSWRGSLAFAGASIGIAVVLATTLADTDLITYARIFPVAIVALSFVMLVGFAGQISLCQLSLAGIGAIVAAHLGAQGQPLALVAAALGAARRRRAHRPARPAPVGHLPRARHRGVRHRPRPVGVHAARTSRSSDCSR